MEPIFRVVNHQTGQVWKIWADGRTEGFGACTIFNGIPAALALAGRQAIQDSGGRQPWVDGAALFGGDAHSGQSEIEQLRAMLIARFPVDRSPVPEMTLRLGKILLAMMERMR